MEVPFFAKVLLAMCFGALLGLQMKRRNEKHAMALGAATFFLGGCFAESARIVQLLYGVGAQDPGLRIGRELLLLCFFISSAGASCFLAAWLPPIDWPEEYKLLFERVGLSSKRVNHPRRKPK